MAYPGQDSDVVGEMGDLICRVANEVARDEDRLREKIIDLIRADDTEAAVAVLQAWNTTGADDLLKDLAKD